MQMVFYWNVGKNFQKSQLKFFNKNFNFKKVI